MEYCMECGANSVQSGPLKIQVGREFFETETEHCKICKGYYMSPALQKKMEKWALSFTKSFMELQPYFSKSLRARLDSLAAGNAVTITAFIKICTAFYLSELTQAADFKELREKSLAKAEKKFDEKNKSKVCVSMRYPLYKKVDSFARVWKLEYETNVFEEAMQVCAVLLEAESSVLAMQLKKFIQNCAMAS